VIKYCSWLPNVLLETTNGKLGYITRYNKVNLILKLENLVRDKLSHYTIEWIYVEIIRFMQILLTMIKTYDRFAWIGIPSDFNKSFDV